MHDREAVLRDNEELRKLRRSMALPDDSGHVAFRMDGADYFWWTTKYPELAAPDPVIQRRAWMKFLNSDEGAKYRVNPTEGKRMPTNGIIVR